MRLRRDKAVQDIKGVQAPMPRHVQVSAARLAEVRSHVLLKGLMVTGAGYLARHFGQMAAGFLNREDSTLVFCQKGSGWWDVGGQLHPLKQGHVLVIPAQRLGSFRGQVSNPWTLQWIQLAGEHVPEFLERLGVEGQPRPVWGGEDLEMARLFTEVLQALERGSEFDNLLDAACTAAHLLSGLILRAAQHGAECSDSVRRIAEIIVYMTEHLGEPLRVSSLARLANLSPTHFTFLFKSQTGCAPRDYLHLLRIHQACRMLRSSSLSIKEISGKVGYQDQFHFSRQFKAFQGVAPTEYRRGVPV